MKVHAELYTALIEAGASRERAEVAAADLAACMEAQRHEGQILAMNGWAIIKKYPSLALTILMAGSVVVGTIIDLARTLCR